MERGSKPSRGAGKSRPPFGAASGPPLRLGRSATGGWCFLVPATAATTAIHPSEVALPGPTSGALALPSGCAGFSSLLGRGSACRSRCAGSNIAGAADQFIDRHPSAPDQAFSARGAVAHVASPKSFWSHTLPPAWADVARRGLDCHRAPAATAAGTDPLAWRGRPFSTRGRIHLYRSWVGSVIGMTNHSEARLAREAEIGLYATLAMVHRLRLAGHARNTPR